MSCGIARVHPPTEFGRCQYLYRTSCMQNRQLFYQTLSFLDPHSQLCVDQSALYADRRMSNTFNFIPCIPQVLARCVQLKKPASNLATWNEHCQYLLQTGFQVSWCSVHNLLKRAFLLDFCRAAQSSFLLHFFP